MYYVLERVCLGERGRERLSVNQNIKGGQMLKCWIELLIELESRGGNFRGDVDNFGISEK